MNEGELKEYEVLGSSVKLTVDDRSHEAQEIVNSVLRDASELQQQKPQATTNDIAVLLALKYASENMEMKKELDQKLNTLDETVSKALKFMSHIQA
jgi:cell division protein ZapA (FtsZ GTPase activity inhibitor)